MKVILVDDEPIALDLLRLHLAPYDFVDIVGSYTDPQRALAELEKLQPDVIFLDIEMGSINGIELVPHITEELAAVEIVFTTAYSQYAVEAFRVNALDYLLKPIQEKRLQKTMDRLQARLKTLPQSSESTGLTVNSFGSFQVLAPDQTPFPWRTQRAKELFAYLWLMGDKPLPKALVLDAVFSDKDTDTAGTLLHTTIYLLRRGLRQLGYPRGITYQNGSYQLNLPLSSDRERLARILEKGQYNTSAIKEAMGLYQGDLLAAEGYPWALAVQQGYRKNFIDFLWQYANKQRKKELFPPVLKTVLDKMYALEPFREDIARMLIHYHGQRGGKKNLQAFFAGYSENLRRKLNIKPLESTINLFNTYMNMEI